MRTITPDDVAGLLRDLTAAYPGFALGRKVSQSERCTTWQNQVYIPQDWDTFAPARQWVRLTHEAVHLAQFQALGTWGFAWRYLVPSGRFRLEQPAYAAEFQAVADVYSLETLRARRAYYIALLSGWGYYFAASEADAAAWVDMAMAAVLVAPT
jgi:hypothetical protein